MSVLVISAPCLGGAEIMEEQEPVEIKSEKKKLPVAY